MRETLRVVFWCDEYKEGFEWDYRTPEEIRLMLESGTIMLWVCGEDEEGINKPYKIVGSAYNMMDINKKQDFNIYLEEITENIEFYRTRLKG